jgi:Ni/Co efflux regulator RcnB
MSNFVVQVPLRTEKYQDDILNKRFEIGRKIYNSLVNTTQSRYKEMIKTKLYRSIKLELSEIYKTDKTKSKRKPELCKQLNELYKQFGINEYSFHADVKNMQHHFKDNIDSFTAQKIASNLWKAYDKLLFGDGDKVHYKKYNSLNSLEGKSNKTGIKFKDDKILWNGLEIPVKINYNNYYEYQSLQNDIAYCRIIRKFIKNEYKFYIQIVFKGVPPLKITKDGEIKRYMGEGDVGLDIGTQTIAISSKNDVKIYELADRVQNIEDEKLKLLRKLDRSRRKSNPENYNEDGTIKKQGNKKVVWIKSNRYVRGQNKLKELYRKQADVRKYQHECLANEIIEQGDNIYVETMNYKGLQKRAKNTTVNEKTGKINKKKRFGKSLANKAPAMLLTIIDRKLKCFSNQLIKIDTWSVKASQYNHTDDSYKKKKLSDRWNILSGIKVQRDMYSAFLIMNVNDDLKSIDQEKCKQRFESFITLHNVEVERLRGSKNLSSIAI